MNYIVPNYVGYTGPNIILLVLLFILALGVVASIGFLTYFIIHDFGTEGMHWSLAVTLIILALMIVLILVMFVYNLYSRKQCSSVVYLPATGVTEIE